MRILPVSLRYFDESVEGLLDYAHRVSSLTHRHARCQMACGFYSAMVMALIDGLMDRLRLNTGEDLKGLLSIDTGTPHRPPVPAPKLVIG